MGDFFTAPQLNPQYQQMPGTLGAAVASQGIKSNAQIAMQQANLEKQKLGLLSKQGDQQNALEQQKIQMLAQQAAQGAGIDQQNADTMRMQQQQEQQTAQFEQQQNQMKQQVMQEAGKLFQEGNVKGWADKVSQVDPKLASEVIKNMQSLSASMATQAKTEVDTEQARFALMDTKLKMIAPGVDALLNAPEQEFDKIYAQQKPILQAAGIDLGDNPSRDQLVSLAALSKNSAKANPLSGESSKILALADGGIEAIQQVRSLLSEGGSLVRAEYAPNIFNKDSTQKLGIALANARDILGRMRSGGAITEDELSKFIDMLPKPGMSAEAQEYALKMVEDQLTQVKMSLDPMGRYDASKKQGGEAAVNPLGMYADLPDVVQ